MKEQALCSLFRSYGNKDYSYENQREALKLAIQIFHINSQVREKGLWILNDMDSGYSMLDRGLHLVLLGVEPELVESVMFNTFLANQPDLLSGLLAIEGVRDIQSGLNPEITRELLKSYFTLDFEDEFEKGFADSGFPATKSGLLSPEEISQLLGSSHAHGQ